MMLAVVSPVDHKLPLASDEVSVTDPPSQKVVTPLTVIIGVAGVAFTITFVEAETGDKQPSVLTNETV